MRKLAWGTVSFCACVFAALMGSHPVKAADDKVNLCPVRAPDNGLTGYVDSGGRWVIPPQYDNAYGFSEGLAEVEVGGKRGFINMHGSFVIPAKLEGTRGRFSEGLMSVSRGGKEGFIDSTGKFVIPPKFDRAISFEDGLSSVKIGSLSGYINKNGDLAIPLQFGYANSFANGLAVVEKNKKYGAIDKSGATVIPFVYGNMYNFSEGLAGTFKDGKYGFIDLNGTEIVSHQYDGVGYFSEGLAKVSRNEKYGYVDRSGKEIIPLKFDFAQGFSEGLAPVKTNGKYGYIDKNGNMTIPAKFDFAYNFYNGIAIIMINKDGRDQYGLVMKNGTVVVDPQYEHKLMYDKPCGNGLFVFQRKKDSGSLVLFDSTGNRITEFDQQELARNPDYFRFHNTVVGDDPQKMYLAAGAFSRKGEDSKARQIYEAIIERFPDSDFAVRANDQLMATMRASESRSATDQINSDAKWRNYQMCKEEMNSCYTRTSGSGQCFRDCESLIR